MTAAAEKGKRLPGLDKTLLLLVWLLASVACLQLWAYSPGGYAAAATDHVVELWLEETDRQHATSFSDLVPSKTLSSSRTAPTMPVQAQVALLVLAAIWRFDGSSLYEEPRGTGSRQHLYWLSVANKRAYAQVHGYPLYVLSHHLEAGRWPTWDKLLAAQAVLKHSRAEWLWMTDADAFVMNLDTSVMSVIASAVQQSQESRGSTPDVIVAEDCLIPFNSGSMIFHNTPWTQQHLADIWHADDNCNGYTDNGAFLELFKSHEVQQHYWRMPQRRLNAYPALPPGTGPTCPNGTFQEGDLLLHFPGDFKSALPAFLASETRRTPPTGSRWRLLQPQHNATAQVPMHSSSSSSTKSSSGSLAAPYSRKGLRDTSAPHDVLCYAVYDGHLRGNTDAASTAAERQHAALVDVTMISVKQQGITTVTKTAAITLSIQQQLQQAQDSQRPFNPGWPVAPLADVTSKQEPRVVTGGRITEIDSR